MTSSDATAGLPATKKPRSSNLELYRIVCMLMIVAHHYVVNSGLMEGGAPLLEHPDTIHTIFLWLFGMWGKTGINCFLMITGYFMCKNQITIKKFLKLILQVYLYNWVIFIIFAIAGYQTVTAHNLIKQLLPFWDFTNNFVPCFIIFYLLIPFLTILVQHLNRRQHLLLILLFIVSYSLLGSISFFDVTFNYITWFSIIFFIAPLTQAGLNPARDLGPRIVAYIAGWGDAALPDAVGGWFWVYVLAPIIGSSLAALFFKYVLEPINVKKNSSCGCGEK